MISKYQRFEDCGFPEADEKYDLAICHYTGAYIRRDEAIMLGAVVPQVRSQFVCHPLAKPARAKSVRAFQELERNCNTCKHLARIPHDKSRLGFLHGTCGKTGADLMFHPDDCMGMECHEMRD